jgi:putative peptidoglycan lipid II flippase
VLLNIVFLIGLTVIIPYGGFAGNYEQCGLVISWCVFAAGFLQLAMLWNSCRRNGFKLVFIRPRMTPGMKALLILMVPGIASAGVQQINLFIGTQIASVQDHAMSWLYYADRVYQLPLGMIGIAFGVVLLPEVSRLLRGGNQLAATQAIGNGIGFSMLLTLPAAIACIVIPQPIITVLFERGEFFASDSRAVSLALAGYALGLPGYVLIKLLQAGYFARENTKTPMKIAAVTVAVNIVVSLILFPVIGYVGIALATSLAAWVNVALLVRGLRGFFHIDRALVFKLAKIFAASAVMGAAVWGAARVAEPWIDSGGLFIKALGLGAVIVFGVVVYAGAALGTRATSLAELKAGFRK